LDDGHELGRLLLLLFVVADLAQRLQLLRRPLEETPLRFLDAPGRLVGGILGPAPAVPRIPAFERHTEAQVGAVPVDDALRVAAVGGMELTLGIVAVAPWRLLRWRPGCFIGRRWPGFAAAESQFPQGTRRRGMVAAMMQPREYVKPRMIG